LSISRNKIVKDKFGVNPILKLLITCFLSLGKQNFISFAEKNIWSQIIRPQGPIVIYFIKKYRIARNG